MKWPTTLNICVIKISDLDMYNNVQEALLQTKPKRCEYQTKWENNLTTLLEQHHISGRIKKKNNNIELLRHFVKNDIDLQELTHSHAFEIILQSIADCDRLAEILKESFKVLKLRRSYSSPTPWWQPVTDDAPKR